MGSDIEYQLSSFSGLNYWNLTDRFRVALRVGAGRAANRFEDLKDGPSRVTRRGFRYLIAKRYGFETGLDIARGPEDTVFYIQGGTAWR